ncbi:MAG: hypothetical protein B6242_03805 [Anaerolineaceae bacterium 4572_78]|nr:MAG: hypothetical protein B6242_03805 [Anaerolineaceae bacterium 4572_78]
MGDGLGVGVNGYKNILTRLGFILQSNLRFSKVKHPKLFFDKINWRVKASFDMKKQALNSPNCKGVWPYATTVFCFSIKQPLGLGWANGYKKEI